MVSIGHEDNDDDFDFDRGHTAETRSGTKSRVTRRGTRKSKTQIKLAQFFFGRVNFVSSSPLVKGSSGVGRVPAEQKDNCGTAESRYQRRASSDAKGFGTNKSPARSPKSPFVCCRGGIPLSPEIRLSTNTRRRYGSLAADSLSRCEARYRWSISRQSVPEQSQRTIVGRADAVVTFAPIV